MYKCPILDQHKNIYDTQGNLTDKSVLQTFSDEFLKNLPEHNIKTKLPVYSDFKTKYLSCCNALKTDIISEKITSTNYYNK